MNAKFFSKNPLFYFKKGDFLVFGIALLSVILTFIFLWDNAAPSEALIYQNGNLLMRLDLNQKKEVKIAGPLGESVVEIEMGKARVKSDPGPKQYCVKQSWLKKSGDIAICAPSHLSLRIVGRARVYDSLSY